jgi:hypothetical protein
MSAANGAIQSASFRDPSGFIFERGGTLYRQVQREYGPEYDRLVDSGLYRLLTDARLLIPHDEAPLSEAALPGAHRVLRPERIPFISFPYEWCFSQLKDAALTTLRIQKEALNHGMSLKDASAYNIQFRAGRPILIDTLSFESYEIGTPWKAYRQFCQHFLAPLALMSHTDIRLGGLLRLHIDGIPLDLAGRLLPLRTRLNPGLVAHVHLHGAAQKRYADKPQQPSRSTASMSRTGLLGLLDSLETTVRKLKWVPFGTEWANYYDDTNYSDRAMEGKRCLVAEMLESIEPLPKSVWDLGANTGVFSRIPSDTGAQTVAWDIDPAAVEKNYLECRARGETRILPLLQDLTNPSPDLGWAERERESLSQRGPADAVLALALIHHLAIGNNVPLPLVGQYLRKLGRWAIVEFVPKSDSQVLRLLSSREDIFPTYTREGFEAAFAPFFETCRIADVPDSERTLFLLRGRELATPADSNRMEADVAAAGQQA